MTRFETIYGRDITDLLFSLTQFQFSQTETDEGRAIALEQLCELKRKARRILAEGEKQLD